MTQKREVATPLNEIFVTQRFGARPEVYKQFGLKGHNGLDLRAKRGDPVYAVDEGTAFLEQQDGGFGIYIKIYHWWGITYYAHLLAGITASGIRVDAGQIIGYADNTGFSTATHLHFGVKPFPVQTNNGYRGAVDPEDYLLFKKKV